MSIWLPELSSLGYTEPLFAPSPVVQATIAAIAEPKIHTFIQTSDLNAHEDRDDDGEPAPMLLSTLDLSHWTTIMLVATEDKEKGLARLKQAHEVLNVLLDLDEKELEEASRNTRAVEILLKTNNPHENWGDAERPPPATNLTESTAAASPSLHPLLKWFNISRMHQAALEDLSESIQQTQFETERAALEASGKGPAIPFLPPRAVEEQ